MAQRDDGRDEQRAEMAARASKIAHDLNNIVSVIIGYSNLLLDVVPADSPGRRMAEEVQRASLAAAELTRQLVEVRREQKALEEGTAAPTAIPVYEPPPASGPASDPGLTTVLVLEDDAGVRRLAESILTRGGYRVLLASEGEAAVALCERHPGAIDLMLADMVLDGQASGELVKHARKLRPTMRVLFMSGYSQEGPPADGAQFLPKPFTADVLLKRVRSLLCR